MSKIDVYVLTLAKKFPAYHPLKGQPTNFKTKYLEGSKTHTIRKNFELWEKRIHRINAGKAILSVREWTNRPYYDGQTVIGELEKVGYQKVSVVCKKKEFQHMFIDGISVIMFENELPDIVKNDGFERQEDFMNWFPKSFDGILMHFTNLKY